MPDSTFNDDLNNEAKLASCLDKIYAEVFKDSDYQTERVADLKEQHKGVDLILSNSRKTFFVDEKAQLDYMNTSLPTFAFELSYLKENNWHKGWFYDSSKITDIYFLITDIHLIPFQPDSDFSKIKIIGVYRERLQDLLNSKGLNEVTLFQKEKELREIGKDGRCRLEELNPKTEGVLFFSKNNKNEKPINLVLKLDFLIREKVGKIIYRK